MAEWQVSPLRHWVAYREGRQAYEDGEQESSQPYSWADTARRCGWLAGYRDRASSTH